MDDLDRAFRDLARKIAREDPLLVRLGQVLAPAVNNALEDRESLKSRHVGAANRSQEKPALDKYCPGCGELSSWAPDLCPECLAVNCEEKS